ncbi:MAG: hypothetical protein N3G21_02150 [Candidatus Hydrogenedentes bacterium]|nr:hypothetical protein [Candidatus Hydrogenedentota bacterium]
MRGKEYFAPPSKTKVIARLAVLGGSSVYIPVFISALMHRNVKVREVVLIGRNEEKLEIVSRFCKKLVANVGYPLKISSTVSVEEGVKDALIILNHIRVGGLLTRISHERLPLKHNMIGDESFGAGSFSNACTTIPVIVDIGNRIKSVNPNAYLINMTNPMGLVVDVFTRHTGLENVIGICENIPSYRRAISELLGVDECQISLHYIGLYHIGFVCDVLVKGKSRMSEVVEKANELNIEGVNKDFIRYFNLIPSRALSIYLSRDAYLNYQKKAPRLRSEILYEKETKILKLYKQNTTETIPSIVYERNPFWYDEIIVPLILHLCSYNPGESIVCVPNKGFISEFPLGTSVEVPCKISKDGYACSLKLKIPDFIRGLMIMSKESDRLMMESIINSSYKTALRALAINPFVTSFSNVKDFLDECLKERNFDWFK